MEENQQYDMADEMPIRRRRRGGDEEDKDRFMLLRNILNIIFMIGAVVGVVIWLQWNQNIGLIVILASMVFKFVECVFRFIK
ncbi:MAG: hypothetical protein Q4D41_07250 [Prevotellaceae bacterium]|nr:hypothetical protein [Prevotellaceae bacterium]